VKVDKITQKIANEIFYGINDAQGMLSTMQYLLKPSDPKGQPKIDRAIENVTKAQEFLEKAREWANAMLEKK
jgi:uncharacterized iron-regulated protein